MVGLYLHETEQIYENMRTYQLRQQQLVDPPHSPLSAAVF